MAYTPGRFSSRVEDIITEFIPICHTLAGNQRYAIAIGGSLGKKTSDERSDVDFRLYTENELVWAEQDPKRWEAYFAGLERWKQRGTFIDGVWCRTTGEIDTALARWVNGEISPVPLEWTIWGYHILPDMYHQAIIEDPFEIIAGWKKLLSVYPPKLKAAILAKYTSSLRYWRGDYHYNNKVQRQDVVFLAGMSAKLVHEILQVLFALNEVYYVGDGSNMSFAQKFDILPSDFSARVRTLLYPGAEDPFNRQYTLLCALIDEVLTLAEAHGSARP